MFEAIEAESGKIGTFGHGFTYSGHPVAAAVALKTIELYQSRDMIGHAGRMAPQFQKHVAKLGEHGLVGEAQGVGLIGGIELVADKAAKTPFEASRAVAATVARFAEEEGVIVRPLMGDRIAICPPLVIAGHEIDELFARLGRALDRGLDWAHTQGLVAS